jgi:signal transduction histidine kinase
VYISRISNVKLEDKSSREGLLENQTFELFKEVLLAIISIVEKDRNTIFYSLSQLNKNTSENEKIKAAAKDALKRIAVDSKNKKLSTPEEVTELKNDATTVAKVVAVLENEIVEKHEEIKILRSLASAGLITAAVAHELRGLKSVLLVRNSELRKLMSPFISEDSLKDKDPAYNPYVLLNEMEKTDKNLHEWLSYALTPLKRDKRLRKNVIIKHYFEDLKIMWTHLLNERRIKLNITDFPETYLLKVFLIDLDTIFNNLIINSIESFARMKMPVTRNITIGVIEIKDYYKISYTDNGSGLDEVYKNRPTDIFLPQETTKKGNGTGMGMYLVKSVIDDNNGKAEILLPKQGFSINLHLPVIKSTPI